MSEFPEPDEINEGNGPAAAGNIPAATPASAAQNASVVAVAPPTIAAAPTPAPLAPTNTVPAAPAYAGTPKIVDASTETNLLVRVIWFVFVGWWLTWVVANFAWILNLTVLGLPAGIYILNRLPQIATLKQPKQRANLVLQADGSHRLTMSERAQRPFWQRALYFVLVGWWFSLIWTNVAWVACVLILTLPLGFWMFGATGKILTLKR